MEKNCSQSTWNRPIEFFLSPSHSQHSSASIFWVFSLSATWGFGRALLLRALGQQYCCDLLLAPDSDSEITRVWWPSSVYVLIVVELYSLVMLRLRSTDRSVWHTTLSCVRYSGLLEIIAWIASRRDWQVEARGCLDYRSAYMPTLAHKELMRKILICQHYKY